MARSKFVARGVFLGVFVLSLSGFSLRYVDPPEKFMKSLVITPVGMNVFPFDRLSVAEFVSGLSKRQLDNRKYPEIQGWTNSDNVYTLHVLFGGKKLEAIFVHLSSEQKGSGALSGLSYRVEGGPEVPGLSLMQFVVTGY